MVNSNTANGVHAHRRLFLDKRQGDDGLGGSRYVEWPMTFDTVYYKAYIVLQKRRLIEG